MARRSKKALREASRLREEKARRLAEEWPGIHPNALKFVRPGAQYVDAHRREYYIKESGVFFKVIKFKGGTLPKEMSGQFMTRRDAEKALVGYLRRTDKFGKARYPGWQEQQRTNSTGTS